MHITLWWYCQQVSFSHIPSKTSAALWEQAQLLEEGVRHARHCSLSPVGAGKSLRSLQRGPDRMHIHLGWLSPSLRAGQWMLWPLQSPVATMGSAVTPTTSTFASSSPAPCPGRALRWPAGLSSPGKPRQEAAAAGENWKLSQQFCFLAFPSDAISVRR